MRLFRNFLLLLPLASLASLPAFAEPELLLSLPHSSAAPATSVSGKVEPGDAEVDLLASYYERDASGALHNAPDPEGEYEWQVLCPGEDEAAPASDACPSEALEPIEHGRAFHVPRSMPKLVRVTVDFVRPSGERDHGEFVLRAESRDRRDRAAPETTPAPDAQPRARAHSRARHAPPSSTPDQGAGPSPRATRGRRGAHAPGGYFHGGGRHRGAPSAPDTGLGVAGASGGSSASKPSRPGKAAPAAASLPSDFESYYSAFGFGGGGSSRTTRRGYNRDNTTPVYTCVSEPGPDGRVHVRCEDSHKELRVKPREAKAKRTASAARSAKARAMRATIAKRAAHAPKKIPVARKAHAGKKIARAKPQPKPQSKRSFLKSAVAAK
jgi:hypothetical protein